MHSKVKDFLTDDHFINYVLGVSSQSTITWEKYFKEHPELVVDAEQAKEILLAQDDVICDLTTTESLHLKDRIMASIAHS